jgi:hypothetical protein
MTEPHKDGGKSSDYDTCNNKKEEQPQAFVHRIFVDVLHDRTCLSWQLRQDICWLP